jgi:hypothetical protein
VPTCTSAQEVGWGHVAVRQEQVEVRWNTWDQRRALRGHEGVRGGQGRVRGGETGTHGGQEGHEEVR